MVEVDYDCESEHQVLVADGLLVNGMQEETSGPEWIMRARSNCSMLQAMPTIGNRTFWQFDEEKIDSVRGGRFHYMGQCQSRRAASFLR